jgi:DNA-binding CsgD family transcriptional regulator
MRKVGAEEVLSVIEASPSVNGAVVRLRDLLNIDHLTYHLAPVDAGMGAPFVKSTYSEHWLHRYLLRGYIRVDPVVQEGFRSQLPFFWSELPLSPQAADLMKDALAFGLGGSGYSVPVVDKHVRRALVSLNSSMAADSWAEFIQANRPAIIEGANRLHRMAIAELFGGHDPLPRLSPREIEILHWFAKGKDHKDIGMIMNMSHHTVRAYMRSARHRLDCSSVAQAVAKATRLGLLK